MAGRPREFDRHEALTKARDAFWRRGYEGTSMADLVEALGIASARIYAAFGSKEALFQEAVDLYASEEGGFADRALAQPDICVAIARMFGDAIALYTRPGEPHGCLIVGAATNIAPANDPVAENLMSRRRARTRSICKRLARARAEGDLLDNADVEALGQHYAALLHGISVQARDGVSRAELEKSVPLALALLPVA